MKVRLFAQCLAREERKWFTNLPDHSILNYQSFEDAFKNKWVDKKNPKLYLSQYHSMRRKESESVQEFSDRFMKVYNVIPAQFKPPLGSSQLQYAEAFDSEFTLLFSEIRSASLDDMMKYSIELEVNLTTTRNKKRDEG